MNSKLTHIFHVHTLRKFPLADIRSHIDRKCVSFKLRGCDRVKCHKKRHYGEPIFAMADIYIIRWLRLRAAAITKNSPWKIDYPPEKYTSEYYFFAIARRRYIDMEIGEFSPR